MVKVSLTIQYAGVILQTSPIADLPRKICNGAKNHCRPFPIADLPLYHFNRYKFYLYMFILLFVILWKNTRH